MVMLRQIVWLINFMNESVGIFVQASNRRRQPVDITSFLESTSRKTDFAYTRS